MAVASKDGWLYRYDRATHKLLGRSETTTHLNADKPMGPGDILHVCPGTLGGAEWHGPAFDPIDRMLFVGNVDWCGTFKVERAAGSTFGGGMDWDPPEKASGWLKGFDASTGQEKWSRHIDGPMLAGLTPTASGLLFTGAPKGEFWALSAKTGEILYRFNTGGAIAGGPTIRGGAVGQCLAEHLAFDRRADPGCVCVAGRVRGRKCLRVISWPARSTLRNCFINIFFNYTASICICCPVATNNNYVVSEYGNREPINLLYVL